MRRVSGTSFELGWWDQMPHLCTYTIITFGFAVEDKDRSAIEGQLQDATTKMTDAFPWLAGTVTLDIPEEDAGRSSGTYAVSTETKHAILRINDLTDFDTYADLTSSGAPVAKLPSSKLSTVFGLPRCYDPRREHCPVFLVQPSFIPGGGLLLTFATHHNVSDMNGQAQLIRFFAQAMRGSAFTPSQLAWGNADRRGVVPPLNDGEQAPELAHLRRDSTLGKDPRAREELVPMPWKMIRFRAAQLKQLKEQASPGAYSATKRGGTTAAAAPAAVASPGWISTNDALVAFMWQCVTRARAGKLPKDEEVRFMRASNGRRSLEPPLPEEYIGHLVGGPLVSLPVGRVVDPQSMPAIASRIRQANYEFGDLEVRAVAALIASEKDRTTISYGAALDLTRDFVMSSWGEQRLMEQEFGALGKPDWTRRPDCNGLESVAYICEKSREGDYYVQASFRVEDWDRLKEDELLVRYAEIIE